MALGQDRGERLAGITIAFGFLGSWMFVLSPGWAANDAFERIGHITAGAAIIGVTLDFFRPKRFWTVAFSGLVILVSSWASFNDGLRLTIPLSLTGALSILAIFSVAFLFVARFDRLRDDRAVSLVTLGMVTLALAVQAAIVGDRDLALTAFLLLMAIAAFALTQLVAPAAIGESIVLGVSMTILAITWALLERDPVTQLGLLLVPFILFADGTARRIPLPDARISQLLYPLALAGIAALPLALGALITFVTFGP